MHINLPTSVGPSRGERRRLTLLEKMTLFVVNGEVTVASTEAACSINVLAFWMAVSPIDKKVEAVVAMEDKLM